MQLLGMIIMPMVIVLNVRDQGMVAIWSCVVIALLFIGVSIGQLANVMSAPARRV